MFHIKKHIRKVCKNQNSKKRSFVTLFLKGQICKTFCLFYFQVKTKPYFYTVKKYYLPFLIILLLAACKKDNDTSPESPEEPVLTPPATYSFTDVSGNCYNAIVQGAYLWGSVLVPQTNKVILKVNVTTVGSYSVSTLTVNGYRFAGSGVFTATGAQTISLSAVGIPETSVTSNFLISNGTSSCSFDVTVVDGSQFDNDHMYLGNPSNAAPVVDSTNNYLMRKTFNAISYSKDRGTPNWVSWHLFGNDIGSTPRQDDFRADNTLPSAWNHIPDYAYSGSGFDKGHNTPSGDRTSSVAANSSTFLMTNMIPQAPYHNQVVWNTMEDSLRLLISQGYELYIIMGSYGTGGTGSSGFTNTIFGGAVTVPSSIFKIAVIIPDGTNDSSRVTAGTRVIAVDIPNNNTLNANWKTYRVSVDAIEAATGYDFLTRLPIPLQTTLEAQVDNL